MSTINARLYCRGTACIEFSFCEFLHTDTDSEAQIIDIVENIVHGARCAFSRISDTRYEMVGEFGTVLVKAEQAVLRIA